MRALPITLSIAFGCLACGCVNPSGQGPKPTATSTVDTRPPKGDLDVGWEGDSKPDSAAEGQPASITPRGKQIEDHLNRTFGASADP